MATIVKRITKGSALTLEEYDANVENLNVELGEATDKTTVHTAYHFHGYAGNQVAGDSKFFDLSGINHAVRGANLSDAQLFTTAGYVSTIDPTAPAPDSVLRIPAVNFDYSAGEKLIVWMLGKWTPEGSAIPMIGDGYSATEGQRGWAIRVASTGKAQPVLYGATSGFGGSTSGVPFDGTLHDFGVVLDGEGKQYCMWVDGAVDSLFGSGYLTFNSGTDHDTLSTNTVNIGSSTPAPGGTLGIATAVRACVILRLSAATAVPAVASITDVFKELRTNPGKLILASAF